MYTYCNSCAGTGYREYICEYCSGSGEGMYDGSRCISCKGSGVVVEECDGEGSVWVSVSCRASLAAVIIDLDGTVSDSEHMHLHAAEIARNEWAWFEYLIRHAPVFPFAEIIVPALGRHYTLIFITARDSSRREQTEKWIETKLGVDEYVLYMRTIGNEVPAAEFKRGVYDTYIKDNYRVKLALDDNPTCISLWNSLQIPTFHVCAGEQLNEINRKKE